MSLNVLQKKPCTGSCTNCPRTARRTSTCDARAACPGYGTSANCPPLIVLAVHECLNAALNLAQPNLAPAFPVRRAAHA
ncbi:MAG: hypothetical protein PW789_19410 [Edaphobacter sp.]|uniref:hypothetical protein n=1 Tax=Edaphobacter sp. TaxID=1934404 RepID=UPI00238E3DC0|nr:hypothetical protein [Edaphobacter sp.]MDE1178748.1 hypothetical protein [Edaphobacter sp.]